MVTFVKATDRDLLDKVHKSEPNKDQTLDGYIKQGREYFKIGLSKTAAKYPADTYVGNFRLLGWFLEQGGVKSTGSKPEGVDIGSNCIIDGVKHKVKAFGDGKMLVVEVDTGKTSVVDEVTIVVAD